MASIFWRGRVRSGRLCSFGAAGCLERPKKNPVSPGIAEAMKAWTHALGDALQTLSDCRHSLYLPMNKMFLLEERISAETLTEDRYMCDALCCLLAGDADTAVLADRVGSQDACSCSCFKVVLHCVDWYREICPKCIYSHHPINMVSVYLDTHYIDTHHIDTHFIDNISGGELCKYMCNLVSIYEQLTLWTIFLGKRHFNGTWL